MLNDAIRKRSIVTWTPVIVGAMIVVLTESHAQVAGAALWGADVATQIILGGIHLFRRLHTEDLIAVGGVEGLDETILPATEDRTSLLLLWNYLDAVGALYTRMRETAQGDFHDLPGLAIPGLPLSEKEVMDAIAVLAAAGIIDNTQMVTLFDSAEYKLSWFLVKSSPTRPLRNSGVGQGRHANGKLKG